MWWGFPLCVLDMFTCEETQRQAQNKQEGAQIPPGLSASGSPRKSWRRNTSGALYCCHHDPDKESGWMDGEWTIYRSVRRESWRCFPACLLKKNHSNLIWFLFFLFDFTWSDSCRAALCAWWGRSQCDTAANLWCKTWADRVKRPHNAPLHPEERSCRIMCSESNSLWSCDPRVSWPFFVSL